MKKLVGRLPLERLQREGLVLARRTIAKYRESLQIPPVNLRKAL